MVMNDTQLMFRHIDGCVRVVDLAIPKIVHTLSARDGTIAALGYCKSLNIVIANGDYDGAVDVWSPSTGERLHTLKGHTQRVDTIVVHEYMWVATYAH
jgi:WD40 repeat protein